MQIKKKQKIKINSSRTKADERKECQKGSAGGESKHEYDDRISLHADDDNELAGNLNKIYKPTRNQRMKILTLV